MRARRIRIDAVVEITVPDGKIIERMSGRRVHPRLGKDISRTVQSAREGRRRRPHRRAPDAARRRPGVHGSAPAGGLSRADGAADRLLPEVGGRRSVVGAAGFAYRWASARSTTCASTCFRRSAPIDEASPARRFALGRAPLSVRLCGDGSSGRRIDAPIEMESVRIVPCSRVANCQHRTMMEHLSRSFAGRNLRDTR